MLQAETSSLNNSCKDNNGTKPIGGASRSRNGIHQARNKIGHRNGYETRGNKAGSEEAAPEKTAAKPAAKLL